MAGSNYVAYNLAQARSDSEKLQARNNIGAAGLSSLAASFESRAPSYNWSAREVCTYGGALWQFDADHSGAWTGADAHEVTILEVLSTMSNEKPTTILSAPIYIGGDPTDLNIYTYANNNHSNTIAFTDRCDLEFRKNAGTCTTTDGTNALPTVDFSKANKLKIKRARITTQGSQGIGAANGKKAAQLFLKGLWVGPPAVASTNYLSLAIDNYNEWQDVNETYDVGDTFTSPAFDLSIATALNGVSSQFTVDDYNLQSAYEGQKLQAYLEIEVESEGLA